MSLRLPVADHALDARGVRRGVTAFFVWMAIWLPWGLYTSWLVTMLWPSSPHHWSRRHRRVESAFVATG
jgi:hypothetical protein